MLKLPISLQRLINELSRLPGIGQKTAQRMGFYLLKREDLENNLLAEAITQVGKNVVFCSLCHNMMETDPCAVCVDKNRDDSVICVVEEPLDAIAIDRSGHYNGLFHVLGGVLNPLEGIGPEKLQINSLLKRIIVAPRKCKEIIIATNPSLEGDTTAMYMAKLIREQSPQIKITRIARGLPMGGDMEYADDITLMRAMEGRREY